MTNDKIGCAYIKKFAAVLKKHISDIGIKTGSVVDDGHNKTLVVDISKIIDEIDGVLEVFTEWK